MVQQACRINLLFFGFPFILAEAASQRFAQNPPQEKDAEMDTSPGVPTQEVPRLVQLLVQNVSQRVCDPRQPLTGKGMS